MDNLSAEIAKATSERAKLKTEVAELQKELAELAKMQLEMDKIRADEKAAFAQLKKDLQEGIDGVRGAIEVLHEHYGSGFLQVRQESTRMSPVITEPEIQPPVRPEPEIQPT